MFFSLQAPVSIRFDRQKFNDFLTSTCKNDTIIKYKLFIYKDNFTPEIIIHI